MSIQNVSAFEAEVAKQAQIQGQAAYWTHGVAISGAKSVVTMPAASAAPGTQVIQVGNSPDGYGKGIVWNRSTEAMLLSLFINAADGLGVSIAGVKSTDYVMISSVSGLASFSEDTGNPLASSIIGVLGAGLAAVLDISGIGAPAAALLNSATKFAQDQFKPTGVKTKIRDGFGVDPEDGQLALEEGGILVTLPGADGPYYSGDHDHKSRWVKSGATRDDAHRPAQVVHGFFPVPNVARVVNCRQAGADGEVYITPWDYKFQDNAGYYEVQMIVSQKSFQ